MLRLREWGEIDGGGPVDGAAALSAAQIAPVPVAARYARWRDRVEARLFQMDLAPDLAEDIGSRRWLRGFATMLALGGASLAAWPDFAAVAAPPAMRLDAPAHDEFRSLAIQPLAYGGDTGRRMGATARVAAIASAPERASLDITATLGEGDSLYRMLERAGVGTGEAGTVAALVGQALPPGELRPGTRFAIRLGQRTAPGQPRRLETVDFRARFDLGLGVVRGGDGLTLVKRPIAVDATPLRVRGVIGNGLYRSARAAGAPIEAIQQYLIALDAHLSLDTDMQPGDTYDIVVAYKRSASGEVQVGDLQFAGLERGGKPVAQLLRWGSDGQFFEASGMGGQRTGLIMPVVGRVTSNYGARRHPVLGYTRMHAGIDFGASYGSPIYAVGDGTVSYAGWRGGHGNYVRLEHGTGFGTGYGHMSRIAVASGTRVRAGQVIGYVGSTGLSTGPHLHYELYQNGRTVNPLSVRFTVSQAVDANELAAFKARIAALKGVKPGAAFASLGAQQAAAAAPRREIAKLGN